MEYPKQLIKYKFKKGQIAWNKGIDSSCEKVCKICGKHFRVPPSKINKRFRCSHKCYGISKQKISTNGFKQCNTCKIISPATTEFFFRDKRTACGLARNCKKCHTIRSREWGKKNPERLRERTRNYMRKHRIGNPNGDYRHVQNKREYPSDNKCEICKRDKPLKLGYHHWNDNDFSKGMWICRMCHFAVHWLELHDQSEYFNLKNKINQSTL